MRSSYVKTLADLPLAANEVFIMIEVCRFACNNPTCEKRIFSERCNDLTEPYSRQTIRTSECLKKSVLRYHLIKVLIFPKK